MPLGPTVQQSLLPTNHLLELQLLCHPAKLLLLLLQLLHLLIEVLDQLLVFNLILVLALRGRGIHWWLVILFLVFSSINDGFWFVVHCHLLRV